jgi:hypothetical protein
VKRFLGLRAERAQLRHGRRGHIRAPRHGHRRDDPFGYQNFFYTGLVEEDAVVLAHAGEPPFVKRWSPATGVAVPRSPRVAQTQPGVRTGASCSSGPIYVQLAKTTDGALYGVTREGSLDRIADGRATPVVRLPPGHRVVAVAAADTLAFVVASDTTPPVHAIVIPEATADDASEASRRRCGRLSAPGPTCYNGEVSCARLPS